MSMPMDEYRIVQEIIVASEDLARLDFAEGLENNVFVSWGMAKDTLEHMFPETFPKVAEDSRAAFFKRYTFIYNKIKNNPDLQGI